MSKGMPNINWQALIRPWAQAKSLNDSGASFGDKLESALSAGAIDRPRERELELERTAAAGVAATEIANEEAAYTAARNKKATDAQNLIDNRSRIIAEQYARKKTLTGGRSTLGYKSILGS